jgi:methylated-DNA-[protein]-cysteine S-methyltransferase
MTTRTTTWPMTTRSMTARTTTWPMTTRSMTTRTVPTRTMTAQAVATSAHAVRPSGATSWAPPEAGRAKAERPRAPRTKTEQAMHATPSRTTDTPSARTHTIVDSPVGELTVVAEEGALVGLYFEGHKRQPPPEAFGSRSDEGFGPVCQQLKEYFAGERQEFDLPLAPQGEDFQRRVWELLTTIPYGETWSYGDLARRLGDPALAQAVGAANGLNPLSIVVPCHRVVAADGSLRGYAGGLQRKRYLLALEEPAAEAAARLF